MENPPPANPPTPLLPPALRRALRARAHHLHPVVAIGQHGLTPRVLHEIDTALTAHELIKLRVFGDDRALREALSARICAALACIPVQHLGKLLILWRARAEPPAEAPATASAAPHPTRRRLASGADAPRGVPRAAMPRRRRAG